MRSFDTASPFACLKNRTQTPLERHTVLSTKSLKEAKDFTSHVWAKHKSHVRGTGKYSSTISRVPLGQSRLCFVDCRAPMHVEAAGNASKATLYLPLSGSMKISAGGARLMAVPGGPAFVPARTRITFDATRIRCVLLEISTVALRAEIAACGGRAANIPPLAWNPGAPGARSISEVIDFALAQIDSRETSTRHAAYAHRLEGLILSTMACAITDRLAIKVPSATTIGRVSVEEMQNWIVRHLRADLTPAKLAAHAGVTARALQIAFLKHFHKTPSAHIRDLRMQAAHAELLTPGPRKSVTEVALALGFSHLGRFSSGYHEKFGELPSATRGRNARGES